MTIDAYSAQFEPLLTESDMLGRIRALLAPAINPAELWVLLLDGTRCQLPVMLPIEDCPHLPEPKQLDALAGALAAILEEHADGEGSVVFVRERLGSDRVLAEDHCWAAGLAGATERAHVPVAGTFLLTAHRVQVLSP